MLRITGEKEDVEIEEEEVNQSRDI